MSLDRRVADAGSSAAVNPRSDGAERTHSKVKEKPEIVENPLDLATPDDLGSMT